MRDSDFRACSLPESPWSPVATPRPGSSVIASRSGASLHHSESDGKRKIRHYSQAGGNGSDGNQRAREEFADPGCTSELFQSDGSEKKQYEEYQGEEGCTGVPQNRL